ncbi:Holliday junction branch migration protein RuvA [Sporolactobacillus shoreicorticis]|uniref:Holliday junction branch migration complex subunit RuvA n=1 Tax=Sporolactobacillus shoreicorticis TaxID=1923877 RepID=A0ABW5S6K7_9BACL|nr:Holliday junction branch migration protein RuvA [Sporolactobacillus shoreicorticis]MCO7126414.1 Holliday junction branch migration protein RuvA [Sporolactobacillus shoreicorticis]
MFDYIKGILTYLSGSGIVIELGGFGYKIICPNPFSYQPLLDKETKIYLYQYVREEANVLYGFQTREERELFVRLLSVSGIGPKNALAILASGDPDEVIQAIEAEDEKFLTRFPGIGKKTAGQIILDLKGKLQEFAVRPADMKLEENMDSRLENALAEATDVLAMLGYSDREIRKVVPQLRKLDLNAENYVKEALKRLSKV